MVDTVESLVLNCLINISGFDSETTASCNLNNLNLLYFVQATCM